MISRAGNKGFLAAHWDWVALGVGVLALAAGVAFFVLSLGNDRDAAVAEAVARIGNLNREETGVEALDMTGYSLAMRNAKSPVGVPGVGENEASFLASEHRVRCACGKAILGDPKAMPKCPYCQKSQVVEEKVALDADADGLPDEWERKVGLNPADASDAEADSDGDGFTNLEEYAAKTNPRDAKSHPDYLDSLALKLPLKETSMPFLFTKWMPIAVGERCWFYDLAAKNEVTAVKGEEIGKSGYVLTSFAKKEAKRALKGGQGMLGTVDVSEVVVTRKGDGKAVTLVLATSKKDRPAAVDVQATLVYERGGTRTMDVVPGSVIDLNGTEYKVLEIQPSGKGAKVVVETKATGAKRVIEALEQ